MHLIKYNTCLTCFGLYSAEAAAFGGSAPTGFGPEGGPGTQGGACTGDFTANLLSRPQDNIIYRHIPRYLK